MDRRDKQNNYKGDKQKYYDRYGEVDRDLDRQQHRHSDRGRPSFDLDNDEYDQRGGRNNDRGRDNYSNHIRSNAGDRYRNDEDDRFDTQNQYSSSRNYGGMGGFGGAQGFGTSRGGYSDQGQNREKNQDRARYNATSGRGQRPDDEDRFETRRHEGHQGEHRIYGGYRQREEDDRQRENRNRENEQNDSRRSGYARSGFGNSGDDPDRHRGNDRISKGDFSPMLGGGPSRGWYTPTEGGYSRQGGYAGQRGIDFGSQRATHDQDDDANYGQTFGDDIHYDPTSRRRQDKYVQDTERRSMEKYGSESRDLNELRGWHYDRTLDRNYGRDNQSSNPNSFRSQDRNGRSRDDNR